MCGPKKTYSLLMKNIYKSNFPGFAEDILSEERRRCTEMHVYRM